jgi:AcrR family transcriptional regulator
MHNKRTPRPGSKAAVRRGPRFTDETTDDTVQRIRNAAVRLVNERGLGVLSFRTLAEDLRVTRTAPMYYFGTTVGLIAAIAEHGFAELSSRLRRVRESGELSEQPLKDLATAYAEYALENPHLYRAMHAAELWHALTDLEASRSRASKNATKKADPWIQMAGGSRRAAFMQFELAVEHAKAAGRVEKEPKRQKGASAHLLTTIVDGFLFHHFEEDVGAGKTTNELLTDLKTLLDRALTGLYK